MGQLETWQATGDPQLWKFIVSPEFGDQVNLIRLTRDLMKQMAKDLGTDLEWIAVEHHNTEHPHVHVALRGVRNDGQALRLSREYVQRGIRSIAEDLCTRQLGYRTELDAAEAERREVTEKRFTSLDRQLLRDSEQSDSDADQQYVTVVRKPAPSRVNETARTRAPHQVARLAVLGKMGLAESTGPNRWRVRRDFEQILQAMQRTSDRQKTLAAHGALMSDDRLPIEMLDTTRITSVEGRVLVHGQDEQSGRNYLMLEGTDAKIHFIHYTPAMEEARSRGELKINSFVQLERLFVGGVSMLKVNDLGNAEALLKNSRYIEDAVRRFLKRGIVPTEDGWGGWLGRYQTALAAATTVMTQNREPDPARKREQQRQRDRSLGR